MRPVKRSGSGSATPSPIMPARRGPCLLLVGTAVALVLACVDASTLPGQRRRTLKVDSADPTEAELEDNDPANFPMFSLVRLPMLLVSDSAA